MSSNIGWTNTIFQEHTAKMNFYPPGSPAFHWVNSYKGQAVPSNAVSCGVDKDGSEIYVGLASYSGDELPAKIVPRRREAYVCYNGREIPITDYKILVEKKLHWQASRDGNIPPGAVPGGKTSRGEQLYIGRKRVEGSAMAVGKVHPSHRCLYVPYAGREMSYKEYEVLVFR